MNEAEFLRTTLDKHMTEYTDQMKAQNKLFREILDRVIGVETKQDFMLQSCPTCQTELNKQGKELVEIGARAKSAHHRIDGIFWGAGILGTLAGGLVNLIASAWKGGHG